MIHIIMGLKGSGKTKKLIDAIHGAVAEAHGDVVCIEYGKTLTYDVSYKYNNGSSNRTHLGFIAQDVQEAISKANLTDKDYAIVTIEGEGFDKTEGKVIDEEKTQYYVRYGELHALEVRQIQLLKAQVKQQAEEIAELKQMVKDLTTK